MISNRLMRLVAMRMANRISPMPTMMMVRWLGWRAPPGPTGSPGSRAVAPVAHQCPVPIRDGWRD